ncbi:MAG TPA: CpsB/CapC family capsule biosynthesis tyrosine phosphatase [Candidatus Sulfotelmatobacter sp.]|jgi:protein-tyrosine phosphatase|nr:CpsB/CapC family capsule biosynthesis tyrosine phosphatase [Candidatus Sulfotelmatobacter sp.]
MVDLHCHILPGIDDGAQTIEDSLAMAGDAIQDGITCVVGTPHASTQYHFDYAKVRAAREELQSLLDGRLAIATGCDFHLNPENLLALKDDATPYCINQKDYLLVEFNEFSIPQSMDQTLHELHLMGLRPIITHPERNAILRSQPERVLGWVRLGCYVQVTAGSLSGVFGPGAQQDAWAWIDQGLVHFVASDGHNTARRPVKLRFAYEAIAKECGAELAEALLVENPKAAFGGAPLPYVPEVAANVGRHKKKRFFFF